MFGLGKKEENGSWETQGWIGQYQMVLCCVPLRTAVFLGGIGWMMVSTSLLAFRFYIEKDRRVFVGGYSTESRVIIDIFESTAVVWGALGAYGALYLRAGLIRVFHYYQAARILLWFAMYALDMPMMLSCELGRDDPQAFTARFGSNVDMLNLAAAGLCDNERGLFMVLSPLTLIFALQFLLASQNLLNEMDEEPRYLLQIPKETPSGAFYTKSLATRSHAAERLAMAGLPVPPDLESHLPVPMGLMGPMGPMGPEMPLMGQPPFMGPGAPFASFGSMPPPPMQLNSMAARGFE